MKYNFESPDSSVEGKLDKLKKAGKKAVLSAALAAGLSPGSGVVVAQNKDDFEKDKIENTEQDNSYEHLVQEVSVDELEDLLDGYNSTPGSYGGGKRAFLQNNKEEIFYISEPVFAHIESAATMASHTIMINAEKFPTQHFDFLREKSNGYEYVTVTLKKHVDLMPALAEKMKKVDDQMEKMRDMMDEYRKIKTQLDQMDPQKINPDQREEVKKLVQRFFELEKEIKSHLD